MILVADTIATMVASALFFIAGLLIGWLAAGFGRK